ncbi:MAG: hypothetical protein HKO97_01805 [Flavobacteriaceae bacterium]|nr:hypothetical protein [Flavobacteriaceae bacterium]
MKFMVTLFLALSISLQAQVPAPRSTQSTNTGPYWTKSGDYDYTLYDGNGNKLTNVKDLKYLSTDTLSVLDKNARDIYLLADFKNASDGSSGKASILQKNVGTNFYITNPYSFSFFVDDTARTGPFCNIEGSYIYYVSEEGSTYRLPDIRKFSNWGSNTAEKLSYTAINTYWYRDADNKEYGIIKEGKTLDYSKVTPEKDGNDMVITVSGVKTYRLPGYYTMASFVYKPVEMYTPAREETVSTGCVKGDCQNGWGKYQYDNGYYDGFWLDGMKNGYGLYRWNDTGDYIGNWANDQMEGYGVYTADNDDSIKGVFRNGQLNGIGVTKTGDKWEQGIFNDGNLESKHTFYSTGNDTGCTAGDCQDKYGRYKWSNGDSFTGFFRNGNMYIGTYKFANGDKYSGMFNNDNQYHGMGRFWFNNGAYYGGQWLNGKYSGRGYYSEKDTSPKVGQWKDGELVKSLN